MVQFFIELLDSLGINSYYAVGASVAITGLFIIATAWLANDLSKRYLVTYLRQRSTNSQLEHFRLLSQHSIFRKISHFAPAIIIYLCAPLLIVEQVPASNKIASFIRLATQVYFIGLFYFIISALLDYFEDLYKRLPIARRRPIKSYLQVSKIILVIIAAILVVSMLLHKSPLVFLTGFGAMTALLTIIFKDSILGFIASIQLTTYDMVRIGDWIEIPEYGADGDVIDMSLNTIKVQNFDKTIVTVPSYALLTRGMKNWRGMNEAGGRRIKRAIYIDMASIVFCSDDDLTRFRKIHEIEQYIKTKSKEIQEYNETIAVDKTIPANGRNLTNIGLFRIYIQQYLKNHPRVHQGLTFLVRQLDPSEHGLPVEIYIFTNTTDWAEYESIQADIFDHILATVPYFNLRVFQNISDRASVQGLQ